MDEYDGQTDSVETEQRALFEPPTDGATDAKDVPSENTDDAAQSQRHCTFCRRRISLDDPTTHSEVTTWVRGPKKDSSVLRSYTGRNACGNCITNLRAGISPNAKDFETLLEEPAERSSDDDIFTDRSQEYMSGWSDGYSGVPILRSHWAVENDYKSGWSDGNEAREQEEIDKAFARPGSPKRDGGEASVSDS